MDSELAKWLEQKRNTAFKDFSLKMSNFQTQASGLVSKIEDTHEYKQTPLKIRIGELTLKIEEDAKSLHSYLSESDREKLSTAIKDLWAVYDPIISENKRTSTVEKVNKDIRDIFERTQQDQGSRN